MSLPAQQSEVLLAETPVSAEPAATPTTPINLPKKNNYEIYSKPNPIPTFPLPTFQPSNPLSVAHLLYTMARMALFPPQEALTMYEGLLFCKSMSVNVVDEKDMFALWQMGFYGKGNLSRSEPNWAKSKEVKKGLKDEHVSEAFTIARREMRRQAKWERARAEQEAINETRLKEALEVFDAALVPCGPEALLALPNNEHDLKERREILEEKVRASQREYLDSFGLAVSLSSTTLAEPVKPSDDDVITTTEVEPVLDIIQDVVSDVTILAPPTLTIPQFPLRSFSTVPHSPAALLALPNSQVDLEALTKRRAFPRRKTMIMINVPSPPMSEDNGGSFKSSKHKAVRFSTQVTRSNFSITAPPSPTQISAHHVNFVTEEDLKKGHEVTEEASVVTTEHLQLTFEEAFFLSFALGKLRIVNRISRKPYTIPELFRRFREYSYMPPRVAESLKADDPFLINYAVYHHFRSLGFVPRPGMKFGVDWLIYLRGPVFDHAEYGVIVQAAYSDKEWKEMGVVQKERDWQWFHGTNRTLAHAFKTFVMVYVEVPGPSAFEKADKWGISEIVRSYKVREFIVKRWSANRNR